MKIFYEDLSFLYLITYSRYFLGIYTERIYYLRSDVTQFNLVLTSSMYKKLALLLFDFTHYTANTRKYFILDVFLYADFSEMLHYASKYPRLQEIIRKVDRCTFEKPVAFALNGQAAARSQEDTFGVKRGAN